MLFLGIFIVVVIVCMWQWVYYTTHVNMYIHTTEMKIHVNMYIHTTEMKTHVNTQNGGVLLYYSALYRLLILHNSLSNMLCGCCTATVDYLAVKCLGVGYCAHLNRLCLAIFLICHPVKISISELYSLIGSIAAPEIKEGGVFFIT